MAIKTLRRQLADPEMKSFIIRAVQEILADPDFGLELTMKAKKRLRSASKSAKKTIPISEIKKKYY